MFSYLFKRYNEVLGNLENLSSKQLEKIESSYRKNNDNISNSFFYQMEAAKEYWDNIITKNDTKDNSV